MAQVENSSRGFARGRHDRKRDYRGERNNHDYRKDSRDRREG